MLKALKHLRFTFPFIALLVLCAISCIVFLAQVALAQTPQAAATLEANATATTTVDDDSLSTETNTSVRVSVEATIADRMAAVEAKKAAFESARADRQAALSEKRTQIETRKTARVAALAEATQLRVLDLGENMTERFTRVVGHLFLIAGRLDTHIQTLKAGGVDTQKAEVELAAANATIEEIRSALASIEVEVTYVITSETPRADWTRAREELTYIRDLIKEAHRLLRSTVAALKNTGNASAAARVEATSATTE